MMLRLLAVASVLLVAACGHISQAGPPSDYRLYEAAADQSGAIVALIDTRSQAAHDRLPLGTPSPDWGHYYTISEQSLLDVDPETGRTQARIGLSGDFQLPPATNSGIPGGLSQNGAWLVLQRYDGASHFLVFDTTFVFAPRPIELPGRFQFDAISNDGERLYLIQYIRPGDYHVRVYYTSGRRLDPNFIFDKSDGAEAMSGERLSGVASHDGAWLFSVYARAHEGAFIHALSLDGVVAFCLDLPGKGFADGTSESLDWSLALSPDGAHLYAANPAMGLVVVANPKNPAITRKVQAMERSHVWPAGAVVGADNRTLVLAGSTGVTWMDTVTLAPKGQALADWTVRSLALSPDGKTLYAVNDRGVLAEISMATRSVVSTFDPGVAHPLQLMRVEAMA